MSKNNPQPVSHTFWATTFFAHMWPAHDQWKDEIIRYLYAQRDEQDQHIASGIATSAKSGKGIFESDFDLLERDHPGIEALRQFILETVAIVARQINGNEVPLADLAVEICDSWSHITNHGGFHDAHYHGGCSWCGIYYLQIGDSGPTADGGAPNGGNRFYCPQWNGGQFHDYGNQYLSNTYIDPPMTDGMVLLFPSFLLHSGLPYQGNKDRIVVSFNSRTALRQN